MEQIIPVYFILINILSFSLMGIDKWKARCKKWRIPEKTLFVSVFLGGPVGGLLGMYTFRHKTKQGLFIWGYWGILVLWLLLTGLFFVFC